MNVEKITHWRGQGEPFKFPLGSGDIVFTNFHAISTLVCLQLDDMGS